MQTKLSSVTVTHVLPLGPFAKMPATSVFARIWLMKPDSPPNIAKITNNPTARKAASLTSDSAAIASIKPSWCSVASIWRVPKRTAKAASASAMTRAVSRPNTASSLNGVGPSSVSIEIDAALSWSAM